MPQPGQARGTLAIALGYGRKGTENFTREEWLGDLFDAENNANNTIEKCVPTSSARFMDKQYHIIGCFYST